MLNFWISKFVVCYHLIEHLGLSGSFWSPLAECLCLISAFSGLRSVFCVANVTSLWWWPICVLVCWCHWYLVWWWVNLFWVISCYWGVWDMAFCLILKGRWFDGLSYELYDVYTKCFCWEDTALRTLEKWLCFIGFNVRIYFGDFFFIYPWVLWVDPLPTFIAAYPIDFVLFSYSLSQQIHFLVDFCCMCGIHSYSLQCYMYCTVLLT